MTDLENIKESTSVQAGLLVNGMKNGTLLTLIRVKGCVEVDLQALCDLVLELDLGLEDVVCGPRLGEDDTVGLVGVLGLEVTVDGAVSSLRAGHFESDVGGRRGLDLESGAMDGEVLAQQVGRRLAKVL